MRSKAWYKSHKDYRNAYTKQWQKDNAEKNRVYQRAYKLRLRQGVIEAYSTASSCACCNEAGTVFLTIDHIDGGGAAHRREIKSNGGHQFYQWLKNNDYPPGYQVLCFNCNSARGAFGYCHEVPPITIRPL